jgi:hypothetical protein
MRKCVRCQEEKEEEFFIKMKRNKSGRANICKKCWAFSQQEKIKKYDEIEFKDFKEKAAKRSKFWYEKQQISLINNEISTDDRIKLWALRRINAPNKSKGRRDLNKELLIKKAKDFLKIFPYMVFVCKKESQIPILFSASIDRLDNELDYTDENSIVVPFWLNLAKGMGTYEELLTCIKDFLKNENL